MTYLRVIYAALQIFTITTLYTYGAQIPMATHSPSLLKSSSNNVEPTVRIQCMSGSMLITIKDAPANYEGLFSGMIYPKGLSKNSTCLSEYRDHEGPLRYKLPLRSCNTMPQETDDGGIEFFNTIVLQPHLKLVTDMGRGYHVRCRYKSRDVATNNKWRTSITKYGENAQPLRSNEDDPDTYKRPGDRRDFGRALDKSNDDNENDDSINDIRMPGCHMKIYNELKRIAENANIGDPLTIVINIDKQDMYGLRITDCLVRDGLGWGEQRLVGDDGCPMDNEIMGQFQYSEDRLSANVTFPAHKFPYTASVYYQCNVKLCSVKSPECRKPLECTENAKRPKRQATTKDDGGVPATIEVYSGLYVNENADATEKDEDSVRKEKTMDDALCVSQRTFAIAIAIAGLILMLAVVAAVVCIMARRRTKTVSTSGSSIYSGPYTNTAFSHSS